MARTPFYLVRVRDTQKNLSPMITKMTHEDSVESDNLLTLEINNSDKDLIDSEDLKEGTILTFQYGFLSGKSSPIYLARISDVDPMYADIINITIRAGDLGIVMKKNESKKIWTRVRSSDIVRQIAAAHGLKAVVTETATIHQSMPQGGKSDYDFIKYLVSLEKDGSMRFFLRNDAVYFTRLELEQISKRTIEWNNGNGILKRFKPYSRESLKQAESRNTVVTTVDPFTNKAVQTVVTNNNSKDDTKLGEYIYDFNSNQLDFKLPTTKPSSIFKNKTDPSNAGKHVASPSGLLDEISNIGNKIKKKSALSDYEAEIQIDGDPDFIADEVITVSGVAKKDTGNWYIAEATHVIAPDTSYFVKLGAYKNAGKKPIGDNVQQTNVNRTVGQDVKKDNQVKKEVPRIYYNENSVEVDRK